jgi:hypothetical protein
VNWWKLRSVGNLYVLKLSYTVFISAPWLSKYVSQARIPHIPAWLLATLFLAGLSLAFANLVYDIWCPAIVKRFPSPNDLYAEMLKIRKLAVSLYPQDQFDASLEHCRSAYKAESESRCAARWLCTVLFVLSGAGFLVVFSYWAATVFTSL